MNIINEKALSLRCVIPSTLTLKLPVLKKPAVLLSLIQQYPSLFGWMGIYAVFWISASSHQTAFAAMIISNMTIVPMLLVWAFIKYQLAPKALHRHQGIFYFSCLLLLIVVSVVATEADLFFVSELIERKMFRHSPEVEASIQRGENQRNWLHAKYIVLLLITMAITTITWLLDERERLNQLQRESRTQLELKYLKAQINPHFLFNALNCIYSLTLLQDEKAPDSVMKLSEMLRYVTDDCRSDRVPLQKEVAYINNFIDFRLIRMEQKPDIQFDCQIENPSYMIPPMVFQPMVENCFKHSRIGDQPDAYIHLSLLQKGKDLTFVAENSIPPHSATAEDKERTGIGLENVRQRMALLFGEKATIDVTTTDSTFRIELHISAMQ